MVIRELGPFTSVAAQMNGQVLQLGRLHGLVPVGDVLLCSLSLERTSMSRMFLSRL